MLAASLAALLAVPAGAEDAAVARAIAAVESMVADERGKDAREIAAMDGRIEALFKDIAPLGASAAAPLGAAARDLKRPAKVRLFAVVFLARLGAPEAVAPLSEVLLDAKQDADVRSAAAQSLGAADVPAARARAPLCAALAQPDLPRAVADDALVVLARLGCEDPAPLVAAARAFGPRPKVRGLDAVRRALAALGRSQDDASARSLLALAAYFPPLTQARKAAISALDGKQDPLAEALATEAMPILREALQTQTGDHESMIVLVRLAAAFGPRMEDALLPLASHPDAEVLAEAAEALARQGSRKALPRLEAIAAGALGDPRFAPKIGRPEPARLLARIEAAIERLRRVDNHRRAL